MTCVTWLLGWVLSGLVNLVVVIPRIFRKRALRIKPVGFDVTVGSTVLNIVLLLFDMSQRLASAPLLPFVT